MHTQIFAGLHLLENGIAGSSRSHNHIILPLRRIVMVQPLILYHPQETIAEPHPAGEQRQEKTVEKRETLRHIGVQQPEDHRLHHRADGHGDHHIHHLRVRGIPPHAVVQAENIENHQRHKHIEQIRVLNGLPELRIYTHKTELIPHIQTQGRGSHYREQIRHHQQNNPGNGYFQYSHSYII